MNDQNMIWINRHRLQVNETFNFYRTTLRISLNNDKRVKSLHLDKNDNFGSALTRRRINVPEMIIQSCLIVMVHG